MKCYFMIGTRFDMENNYCSGFHATMSIDSGTVEEAIEKYVKKLDERKDSIHMVTAYREITEELYKYINDTCKLKSMQLEDEQNDSETI